MLLVIPDKDIHPHAAAMERAVQLRHKIFVDDRDRSDLDQGGGLERGEFDDDHTLHRICLNDEKIIGNQGLLSTPQSAPGRRDTRRTANGLFLELTHRGVERALAHRVDTGPSQSLAITVTAVQLRFFVQPLGLPAGIWPRRGRRPTNIVQSGEAAYDLGGEGIRGIRAAPSRVSQRSVSAP
jgi:acyl-homoserine lactone synthase